MRDYYRTREVPLGNGFSSRAYLYVQGTFKQYYNQDYCTLPLTKVKDAYGRYTDQYAVLVPTSDTDLVSVATEIIADMPGNHNVPKNCTHIKPVEDSAIKYTFNGIGIADGGGEIGMWVPRREGHNITRMRLSGSVLTVSNIQTGKYRSNPGDKYHTTAYQIEILELRGLYVLTRDKNVDFYVYDGEYDAAEAAVLSRAPWNADRLRSTVGVLPQGHIAPPNQVYRFGEEETLDGTWPSSEEESWPEVGWAYSMRREADTSFASKSPLKNALYEAYSQAVHNLPKANSNSYQNVIAVFQALKVAYDVAFHVFDTDAYREAKRAGKYASRAEYAADFRDEVRKAEAARDNIKKYGTYATRKKDTRTAVEYAASKYASSVKRASESLATKSSTRSRATQAWDIASSAWLTNRYVINTSKMDIEEGIAYANEMRKSSEDVVVSHGGIVRDGARFNCTVHFRPNFKEMGAFGALEKMWELGFANPLYTTWDSVPFSFMVDWFIPVGPYLEAMDDSMFLNSMTLGLQHVIYSVAYTTDLVNIKYEVYTRWNGRAPSGVVAVADTNDGTMQQTKRSTQYVDHYKQHEDQRTMKRCTDVMTIFLH
jgi:hypothetical protein